VFEHAVPVLQAFRIPATVFVVTDASDRSAGFWWDQQGSESPAAGRVDLPATHRAAGWDAIRAALNDGLDLGVHSATHRSLPTLTAAELEDEVTTSRTTLQRITGVLPQFFAYPYGHWDRRVRAMVRAAGYRAGVTVDHGLVAPSSDRWALRRVNVPAGISDAALEAWSAGLPALRRA
jgi:peptidoglycan/xylan/chitin deacetylase (PgdA/CDA1 family)